MIYIENAYLDQSVAFQEIGDSLVFKSQPNQITKMVKKEYKVGNDLLQNNSFFKYFIVGGNWNLEFSNFAEDRNFLEMQELIHFKEEYAKSNSFKRCVNELKDGNPQKNHLGEEFKSLEDVRETFEYYLKLIRDMKTNGYVKQNHLTFGKADSEIGVAISPNSELFHFRTGHHRLAIAKAVNLEHVYVKVHFVHKLWVDRLVGIYGQSEVESIKRGISEIFVKGII